MKVVLPWKVDYLFTAGVLKMKMCLISGYWISVHRFKSCTIKASEWLQLVRRDFGMFDKLNESSSKIPWKVDYLFTAVVQTMNMCLISGYWISVHRFKSCTIKASEWLQLVRRDFGTLDKLNESSTKIPWKVDYLFTAVVQTMKMCLSCCTENEDVPHKWILYFSTSIQVLHNKSIGMTSAGSPWLRYVG